MANLPNSTRYSFYDKFYIANKPRFVNDAGRWRQKTFMTHPLYDSNGRPYEPIDLAEQFRRFAAMVKSDEPVGTGNELSALAEHGNSIMYEKEKE